MSAGKWLTIVLGVLIATVSASDASLRRKCRRLCRQLVQTYAESLPLPQLCSAKGKHCTNLGSCERQRRIVLDHCRNEGVAYCQTDWGPTLNRCNAAWAEDHRGETDVTVQLVLGQLGSVVVGDFSPECIRVDAGTRVTFVTVGMDFAPASFASCALAGGVVGSPDPESPFTAPASGGTPESFTLSSPGFVPYFCTHGADLGGAVIVEP